MAGLMPTLSGGGKRLFARLMPITNKLEYTQFGAIHLGRPESGITEFA